MNGYVSVLSSLWANKPYAFALMEKGYREENRRTIINKRETGYLKLTYFPFFPFHANGSERTAFPILFQQF